MNISEDLSTLNLQNVNIDSRKTNSSLLEIKKQKLISFAISIMENPLYLDEFRHIFLKSGVTQDEVLTGFLDYNLDIFSPEGNDIYNSLTNRIVLHIHNLLDRSWHIGRQSSIVNMIKKAQPKTLVDIGFGVPSRYVKDILKKELSVKITLSDLYDSAFRFAKILLEHWSFDWENRVDFKHTNMDQHEFVGSFDMYMFQDSIEHTPDPTSYLQKYVEKSPSDSKFLFSLPIGPIIPRHYVAWETNDEAIQWLKSCGLSKIENTESVSVNPEVDLFAEQLNYSFHNLIILCSK